MATNINFTGRTDAESLMKPAQSTEIIKMVGQKSAVLSRMKKLPNMSSSKTKMPIISMLPQSYFVDGDTGLKQTTKAAWKGKEIVAEELAVIVPVPEAVIADADYPIVQELIPLVIDAFTAKIDNAILNGADRPASWPEGLFVLARNNGHIVSLDSSNDDMYQKVMGVNGLLHSIEKDGFAPNGVLGNVSAKAYIRGLTNKNGNQLTMGSSSGEVDGLPVSYVMNGAWTDDKSLLLAGDFSKVVYSIRQDITFEKFTEGVISDDDGKVIYNLMQNDMVAFRFVMRLGWNFANPITQMNGDEEKRFPLTLLTESSPSSLTTVTFTLDSAEASSAPVQGATVMFGDIERKTNALGKAVFDLPANAKGPWLAKKGNVIRSGVITKASSSTDIKVQNFK